MSSATIFQIQSALIVLLFTFGILKRRSRNVHVKTMYAAIFWDIALILQIELTRSAIVKASKAITNPMMLNIHVALALTAVILYFILIYTGRKLVSGQKEVRQKHKLLGWSAYITRILVFVTSFFTVSQ